jgi:hypothetical protein
MKVGRITDISEERTAFPFLLNSILKTEAIIFFPKCWQHYFHKVVGLRIKMNIYIKSLQRSKLNSVLTDRLTD